MNLRIHVFLHYDSSIAHGFSQMIFQKGARTIEQGKALQSTLLMTLALEMHYAWLTYTYIHQVKVQPLSRRKYQLKMYQRLNCGLTTVKLQEETGKHLKTMA